LKCLFSTIRMSDDIVTRISRELLDLSRLKSSLNNTARSKASGHQNNQHRFLCKHELTKLFDPMELPQYFAPSESSAIRAIGVQHEQIGNEKQDTPDHHLKRERTSSSCETKKSVPVSTQTIKKVNGNPATRTSETKQTPLGHSFQHHPVRKSYARRKVAKICTPPAPASRKTQNKQQPKNISHLSDCEQNTHSTSLVENQQINSIEEV